MIKNSNDVLSGVGLLDLDTVRGWSGRYSELITLNSEAIASAGPRSSMVELLICNQRVGGSNPSVGSITPLNLLNI